MVEGHRNRFWEGPPMKDPQEDNCTFRIWFLLIISMVFM
jgi:hypothetical protein